MNLKSPKIEHSMDADCNLTEVGLEQNNFSF